MLPAGARWLWHRAARVVWAVRLTASRHLSECWAVNTGHAAHGTFPKNADPGSKQTPPKCGAWVQGLGLCRGSSAAKKLLGWRWITDSNRPQGMAWIQLASSFYNAMHTAALSIAKIHLFEAVLEGPDTLWADGGIQTLGRQRQNARPAGWGSVSPLAFINLL